MTRGLGARLAPTLALLALLTLAGVAGLRGGPATDTPASGAVHQPEIGARLAATSHADPAAAAARWLAGQLVDGGLPGFVGTDWGLTIDALFALQAIGTEPKAVTAVTDALAASADEYAAFRSEAGDFITGGATAKILVAAVVAGQDPTDFGGYDWRQRTLELVHGPGTGAPSGWLFNRNLDATTGANMFDQSLAVIGLARSGGVDQSLVDFLITQQCPDGGFRLYPGAAGTPCADDPPAQQVTDVDTTAYALQALLAAAETGATGTAEPITRATDWLLAVQHSDGSFIGSVVTAYPNTNSTGLAAQALAAVGETAAAAKAAEFTLALQLTQEDGGAAADHAGAIAYTPDSYTAAVTDGIADFELDQWRRASAQGILGLAQVPLGNIGPGAISPSPSPSPQPTPTSPVTPTPTQPTNTPQPSPTGGQPTPSIDPTTSPQPSPPAITTAPPAPSENPPPAGVGRLPTTGLSMAAYGLVGGGAVIAGAALLTLARRRKSA